MKMKKKPKTEMQIYRKAANDALRAILKFEF